MLLKLILNIIRHVIVEYMWLLAAILAATGGYRWLLASHVDGWGLRVIWRLYWRLLAAIDGYW